MLRILGPLDVAGEPVPGGPKGRALLALLVLHANETVPRERILEELWNGGPPASARHAVEVYVSRLRRALAPVDGAIAAGGGGYRLALDGSAVDATVFERLVAEGRDRLADGDAAGAAARLRDAEALWRGPALADVRYERFAQSEVARLEELRLVAVEARIEAELGLGRHAEAVTELEALVVAEPLRERLRALLMLALYRGGRQADALAAYREGARLLREELGLDPGPELRQLEAAILRHDPGLEPGRPRVHLPAPLTPIVGREGDVAAAGALLRGGARLVTLIGPGGVGKTRLALEVAAGLAAAFPDGVHFAALAPVADPALVPSTIATALSIALEGEDPLDALRARLGAGRVLLVLDNFEHLVAASGVVGELLRACPGAKALVTSRAPLRVYGEHVYAVPGLADDDAVELFEARARAAGAVSAPADRDTVAAICARLDGLPLAIELVAARAGTLAPEAMLAGLPLALAVEGPRDVPARQQTLRAAVGWSHDLLEPPEAAAFRRLGVFAGGCGVEAAREVAGADAAVLDALARQSLVRREPGRLEMLATIREYALERLEAAGEGGDVRRRHARHYLALARSGDRALRAGGDQTASLDELEREHDNLRAALAWAAECEPALELALAGALASFWALRGHVDEGRRRLAGALARGGADAGPAARAWALAGAGILARCAGDVEAARPLLEGSLSLHREQEDWPGVVRALCNLGFVELLAGARARARAYYEEALVAAGRSGSGRDRALAINCLADLALRDGDHARVDDLSLEGFALAREGGDVEGMAVCLLNRAYAAYGAGRDREALSLAGQALEAWAPLADRAAIANCLDAIAAGCATDEPETAAALLAAAAELRAAAGGTLDVFEAGIRQRAERSVAERLGAAPTARHLGFDDAVAEGRRAARRVG